MVTSGSRRSSQSTSSPQLSPDLVTSDLLEERERSDATVKMAVSRVQHQWNCSKKLRNTGKCFRETNLGTFLQFAAYFTRNIEMLVCLHAHFQVCILSRQVFATAEEHRAGVHLLHRETDEIHGKSLS